MSYEQYRPSQFRLLPPVVKNLLIINGLFFFATYVFGSAFGIDLNDILGLHYFGSEKFHAYQLLTYMFMHGNLSHIFLNMFALWMFGNVLENYWGGKRFLIYYLICGMGAALTHYTIYYFEVQPVLSVISDYIANPDLEKFNSFIQSDKFSIQSADMRESYNEFATRFNALNMANNPASMLNLTVEYMVQYKADFLNASTVVGASGSVFGILLAFGMMFPNTLLYVYFAIPIKAKYFVILYGLIELFSGVFESNSNVAHFAHLGGMLFGFVLIKLWKKNHNLFM